MPAGFNKVSYPKSGFVQFVLWSFTASALGKRRNSSHRRNFVPSQEILGKEPADVQVRLAISLRVGLLDICCQVLPLGYFEFRVDFGSGNVLRREPAIPPLPWREFVFDPWTLLRPRRCRRVYQTFISGSRAASEDFCLRLQCGCWLTSPFAPSDVSVCSAFPEGR